MTVPVLDVRGLSAGYGDVAVVRGVDLHVGPGEVVALLGANGAGKTTTLLAISGLLPQVQGRIEVGGDPVVGTPPAKIARLGVAHVPEDRALFPGLTVSEHLRLASPRGTRTGAIRALELFPALEPLLDRRAGLLSGGEQQMLALARAMVTEPRLLMIDEMSLGLAPVIVERLLPVVRRAADERGAGVLLVEQHVDLALGIADRAYVLRRGLVAAEGSAAEFRVREDLLAAAYLGDAEPGPGGNHSDT